MTRHDMREISRSVLNVAAGLRRRSRPGSAIREPSRAVMDKAALLIAEQRVDFARSLARVYTVEGNSHSYKVLVYVEGPSIVDAECSCESGRAKKTCSHLVAALARACAVGYEIEV